MSWLVTCHILCHMVCIKWYAYAYNMVTWPCHTCYPYWPPGVPFWKAYQIVGNHMQYLCYKTMTSLGRRSHGWDSSHTTQLFGFHLVPGGVDTVDYLCPHYYILVTANLRYTSWLIFLMLQCILAQSGLFKYMFPS